MHLHVCVCVCVCVCIDIYIYFSPPDRGNRIDETEAVSEENAPEKKTVWSL